MTKMKLMNVLSAVLMVSGSLVGCSNATVDSQEVKPQSIRQSAEVTYDESTDRTSYWAQFRVGDGTGTTVRLTPPSEIKSNNVRLNAQHGWLEGTYYSYSRNGLIPEATFVYVDDNQKVYTNQIEIQPVNIVQAAATVSGARVYVIQLNYPKLRSNETLNVSLSQEQTNEAGQKNSVAIYAQLNHGKKTATFSVGELAKLINGSATLHVSRTLSTKMKESPRRGYLSATYKASSQALTLVDLQNTPAQLRK